MTAPNPDRRSERARQAILTAGFELCQERGLSRTTVEDIAKRAGVGKQTIYRWWSSKAAVVLDALNERAGGAVDLPDTDDPIADVRTRMTALAHLFAGPDFVAVYRGLIAAAQDEPAVAEAILQRLVLPRVRIERDRLNRAQQQGLIRADVDPEDIVDLLYAPLYYRMLLRTRPVSPQQVTSILDLALSGLRPQQPQPTRPRRGQRAGGSASGQAGAGG